MGTVSMVRVVSTGAVMGTVVVAVAAVRIKS